MQGFRPRDWPSRPASPPRFAVSGDLSPAQLGWSTSMPSERDLFAEEQTMATMSFGEHIEELRVRLILALAGLFVGVIVAFIPFLDLGWRVMKSMEAPAADALERFYRNEYDKKAKLAEDAKAISPTLEAVIPADSFFKALKDIAPKMDIPPADQLKGKTLSFPLQYNQSTLIKATQSSTVMIDKTLISLGPLETITIYFMVCLVTGLVLVSPGCSTRAGRLSRRVSIATSGTMCRNTCRSRSASFSLGSSSASASCCQSPSASCSSSTSGWEWPRPCG